MGDTLSEDWRLDHIRAGDKILKAATDVINELESAPAGIRDFTVEVTGAISAYAAVAQAHYLAAMAGMD
jgi:hypothetical protein